jgi:hypothetical protein
VVVVAVVCAATSDPTAGDAVAEPVGVRRLTDEEGQRLQQIVRQGSTNSVRYRRGMMLSASVRGNRVPVIALLVQADEDIGDHCGWRSHPVRSVRANRSGDKASWVAAAGGLSARRGSGVAGRPFERVIGHLFPAGLDTGEV